MLLRAFALGALASPFLLLALAYGSANPGWAAVLVAAPVLIAFGYGLARARRQAQPRAGLRPLSLPVDDERRDP